MPDEIRYRRKFSNTSMSAGDMEFNDINIGMYVISFILQKRQNVFFVLFFKSIKYEIKVGINIVFFSKF